MAQTLVEKIIAAHSGRDAVRPGEEIAFACDAVVFSEREADAVLDRLEERGGVIAGVRVAVLPDRFVAVEDPSRLAVYRRLAEFGDRPDVELVVPIGRSGLSSVELVDRGFATPGGTLAGCDPSLVACGALASLAVLRDPVGLADALADGSVTRPVPASRRIRIQGETGRWCMGVDVMLHLLRMTEEGEDRDAALELSGVPIERLDVVDRLAFVATGIGLGAAAVFCLPDDRTLAWLRARTDRDVRALLPDRDAEYAAARDLDVKGLEPMVAPLDRPRAGRRISEMPDVPLDQVVLGGRVGGRVEELRVAARLLKEHPVHHNVRLVVMPATQRAFLHAVDEGLIGTFIRCGAVVAAPTSGIWGGEDRTTAGPGEHVLTTDPTPVPATGAEVYVASAAVAAASAALGRIAHPDEVLRSRREAV